MSLLAIALLIVSGLMVAAGGGAVLGAQKRRKELEGGGGRKLLGDGELAQRSFGELRVGDVVVLGGRDFVVEGTVSYDEDGHRWLGARMCDGSDVRWVMVGLEGAGGSAVRIYEEDPALHEGGAPPEAIATATARYALERRGIANAKVLGNAGGVIGRGGKAGSIKRCRWWRYEGPGGHCALIEEWNGGAMRNLRGRTAGPADLDLIPGS